ncbi:hypothetical protein YC2023_093884 [Brassica napus]
MDDFSGSLLDDFRGCRMRQYHKQNYYRSFFYKDKLGLHLIWKKTLSKDFQKIQTTSRKSRRLPGSPDDFQEVQTTSRKSRRLPGSPDDFQEVQTTEMEVSRPKSLPDLKTLHIKSRSEKPAYPKTFK